eukprot:TRINITY_DN7414_c0_g1_i1.p1 TRINITY_DN7414_c0_g1~~TRINITY_DN7414_c0_g1_i1.p1  ORF type:complete len:445 (-),score=106.33 TRINITY_DN7414_c0_g1_i1:28-1362(-)
MEEKMKEKERMKQYARKLIKQEIDELPTTTTNDQEEVENMLAKFLNFSQEFPDSRKRIELYKDRHTEFLWNSINNLHTAYQSLEASKPWISYWILNSLMMMKVEVPNEIKSKSLETLALTQESTGGFSGSKGTISHMAPTYAATRAIALIGTEEAYKLVDRKAMYEWLMRVKNKDGSFSMHEDGESDVRSTYCAISVASMLNLIDENLVKGTAEYIRSCQTYEGGIGQCPFNEAHGGYTFCGVAAAQILGTIDLFDIPSLFEWLTMRQMKYSGGFQGRTNKLVDGCYSFWLGACFVILQENGFLNYTPPVNNEVISQEKIVENNENQNEENIPKIEVLDEELYDEKKGDLLFNQITLQEFILLACQDNAGGLRDKPNRFKDLYHTSYCLSGLSIAQNNFEGEPSLLGLSTNHLTPIDTVHNVVKKSCELALQYYKNLPTYSGLK